MEVQCKCLGTKEFSEKIALKKFLNKYNHQERMMIFTREGRPLRQIKVQISKVQLNYNPTMTSKAKKQKMAQTILMILIKMKTHLLKIKLIGLIKERKIKKKRKK